MSVLAAALTRLDDATDGQLLGRFVQSRDADAFTTLVHRLGPTVLAVCRRVCPDVHLAEDAFQAAFLVLATKAESVRPREQVAVWLHGVAYRTASKARAMLANRRRREVGASALPESLAPEVTVPDDDELRKLDDAIATLPDRLRAVVVLCELEGRSRKDAAKQLGIPEGTVRYQLAEARKRLGARLRPTVAAVVTAALAARTAEAAFSGSTSEAVRALAHGVISMMLLNNLKLSVALLLVAVATLSGGTFFVLFPSPSPVSAAPVPKAKTPNYFPLIEGSKWVYDQDGQEVSEEVTKVATDDEQTRVTTSYRAGPRAKWEKEYVVKDGTVYETRAVKFVYDPPVRVLDLDLKAGAKWASVTPPVKGVIATTGEMVAGEVEEVTVPAGTFKAVPVVHTVTEENGVRLNKPKVYTNWYAEGVGLVKLKYDDGEKVLKSFTPGKAKDEKKDK